jgi:hypothetical protein
MVSLNDNSAAISSCRNLKRGDTRDDGYRFYQYQNKKTINGESYVIESWLSPQKYKETTEKRKIASRERMRRLRKNPDFVLKEKEKEKNPDVKRKKLKRLRIWEKKRRKTNPLFMLKQDISSRIRDSFKYKTFRKKSKTSKILGCSYSFFKAYIEARFQEGMSWQNRSSWHLDHIIPLSTAKTKKELIKLNHYTNLRPLWAIDNMIKSDKMIEEQLLFT